MECTAVDGPVRCGVAALAADAAASGSPAVVGVDGPGAAGKSTLASLLADALPGPVAVVHGDDFYLPSGLRGAGPAGHGTAFDLERLRVRVLAPVTAGVAAAYQVYDWDNDRMGGWVELPDNLRAVVVEGVYSTELRLRHLYTYRVFCTAPRQTRLARGLQRDGHQAQDQWGRQWMPAEDLYLRGQRPDLAAHVVLDGGGCGSPPTYYVVPSAA